MVIGEFEFFLLSAIHLVFAVITTILFIQDSIKAKQEERRIKPVYIVLFSISWGIIAVITIIFMLIIIIMSYGMRGM